VSGRWSVQPIAILFATDGSPEAAEACRVLNLLPLPAGSVVHVISAIHVPPLTDGNHAPWQSIQYLFEFHGTWAAEAVEAAKKLLARQGVRVEASIPRGDPAPQILHTAEAIHADLVVLGPNGLTGGRPFLGSVARNVAKRCQRPVLVARKAWNEIREVVVATDGSEHATHAVGFLSRLPLPDNSGIILVHVVRPPRAFPGLLPGRQAEYERAAAELRTRQEERGRTLLAEAASLLPPGRSVRQELCFGDPAAEVLRITGERDADLIVMGARGTSLLEGLRTGSVADRLLRQAVASVLIVH
jgi:nucleotide-binding universal stress UspA family protein